MNTDTQLEEQTNRIADAIVELVERTNGPVTLARVDREVAGFAQHEGPSWSDVVTWNGGEASFWEGMSEPGVAALGKVIDEHRVAVQYVNFMPYLLDGRCSHDEYWQPIVLLPARAANVELRNRWIRVPKWYPEWDAAKETYGVRLLTPVYSGATADYFFGISDRLLQ